VFLLVPAHPGSPGRTKGRKRLLLYRYVSEAVVLSVNHARSLHGAVYKIFSRSCSKSIQYVQHYLGLY